MTHSKASIVVLTAGFVYVGNVTFADGWVVVRNTYNIRVWGTTDGLGQLVGGPLESTTLDHVGVLRAPLPALVSLIDVDDAAWAATLEGKKKK